MTFNVGDVVQLKSGGPSMTVVLLDARGVCCNWFDGGTLLQGTFSPDALRPAVPDPFPAPVYVPYPVYTPQSPQPYTPPYTDPGPGWPLPPSPMCGKGGAP